jgi:hypothetical protein
VFAKRVTFDVTYFHNNINNLINTNNASTSYGHWQGGGFDR